MAKTKSSAVKATKDTEVKPKISINHGSITKSSQTPKSKSKEISKQAALKAQKAAKEDKKSKKSKKEPTPPPEPSSSESDEESGSSASSDDESEAEAEVPKAAARFNGVKANGGPKPGAKAEAESSESSDSSASSESSDSDDDEVEAKPVLKPGPADVITNDAIKANSEEDSEDSEDSEDEDEAVPKVEAKKVLNGTPEKASAEVCNFCRRLICWVEYQDLTFLRPHLTKIPRILAHLNPILERNPTKRRPRKLLFLRNARLIPKPSRLQRNQKLQKPARPVADLTCLLVNYPGTLMRIGSPESLANTGSLLALKSLRTRRQAALKGLHDQ